MSGLISVRVAAKKAAAQGICALSLEAADGGALPAFTAGAHVDLHLPGGLARPYSICNDPAETHRYVLGVLLEIDSRGGSRAVHELREGQVLQISTPRNRFPLEPGARRHVLIAGGIGITPILAMARQLGREGADFELHYASSSQARMAFREEIEMSSWAGAAHFHTGDNRLDIERLLALQAGDVHVYACGPKRLIDAVTGAATRLGWAGARVHHEFFSGDTPAQSAENRAFEIELARSGRIIPVAADQSAAAALIAAGVPLLTSCEQGVCGTCLTPVLQGQVEHRDLYLTPEEQAANDQFLPCCSRALGARLVVDLG